MREALRLAAHIQFSRRASTTVGLVELSRVPVVRLS